MRTGMRAPHKCLSMYPEHARGTLTPTRRPPGGSPRLPQHTPSGRRNWPARRASRVSTAGAESLRRLTPRLPCTFARMHVGICEATRFFVLLLGFPSVRYLPTQVGRYLGNWYLGCPSRLHRLGLCFQLTVTASIPPAGVPDRR